MKREQIYKKTVASIMLFGYLFQILFSGLSFSKIAYAAPVEPTVVWGEARAGISSVEFDINNLNNTPRDTETIYDLVVILVDSQIADDNNNYPGLSGKYPDVLENGKLSDRIIRYAQDISGNYDMTDSKILFVDKTKDSVRDISAALENMYFNGDGNRNNRLAGVMIVGEVPLPVVNRNGNKFVSLYPYTDFVEKTFVYNSKTQTFDPNEKTTFPRIEVFHGVINPTEENLQNKFEMISEFFDKNHLYYSDVPEYSEFGKKIFFGDLIFEAQKAGAQGIKKYKKYIESLEDQTYNRYNKYWANDLINNTTETVQALAGSDSSQYVEMMKSTDNLQSMPDLQSKQIITQNISKYYQVVEKYISQLNDWLANTGRYQANDVDNVASLISMKDEYSKEILKKANIEIETKITELVEKIQEPLPILDYSIIKSKTGEDINTIETKVSNLGGFFGTPTIKLYEYPFRFNYLNEVTNKYYVNGVESSVLSSPKQCAPFLGSTKDIYFDEDLNYNPKAVSDGEYSVLTRSMSSDNILTYMPVHTAGVNTRMISARESKLITGIEMPGAFIEDNLEKGLAAFLPNPISTVDNKYKNPLEGKLQKGDLIVKVNDKEISSKYTFDDAIESIYKDTYGLMSAFINQDTKTINDFPYEYVNQDDQTDTEPNTVCGNVGVEFYRDGQLLKTNFTFSMSKDGLLINAEPSGEPSLFIVFSRIGYPDGYVFKKNDILFDRKTDGAIFSLYSTIKHENKITNHNGYSGYGYDNSAGCSKNASGLNPDRCFPQFAQMPVTDPGGSIALAKVQNSDGSYSLRFAPMVTEKTSDGSFVTKFSEVFEDKNTARHMSLFQFPENKKYEEIDEVYMNACYNGLPTVSTPEADSNPYLFVLDPLTRPTVDIMGIKKVKEINSYDVDLYGNFLLAVGEFIADFEKSANPNVSPDITDVWKDLDNYNASQVILNNVGSYISLEEFSSRYGLFDGMDNDNDGLSDFEYRDLDGDGTKETKWYDYEEADSKYGIPSEAMDEIARKLLSKNASFTIPAALNEFGEDLTLEVSPHEVKKISSVILHNEPTNYTITRQLESFGTYSLPIDNPRYIAFQTKPDGENQTPGKIQKLIFPNTFDTPNLAQFQADMKAVADKLALMPGSYRIFGEEVGEGQYTAIQISDEIYKKYLLPALSENIDTRQLSDAINWSSLDIDSKHEYVLMAYLDENQDAYINDQTVSADNTEKNGYEISYLAFDGEESFFDLDFDKDLPEETDPRFNPLAVTAEADTSGVTTTETESDTDTTQGPEDYLYVDWTKFIDELEKFVDSFTEIPEFKDCCTFAEEGKNTDEKAFEQTIPDETGIVYNIISDKTILRADGNDAFTITVSAPNYYLDPATNKPLNNKVRLIVQQNDTSPVLAGSTITEKTIIENKATFKINSTNNSGYASIYAENSLGQKTNIIKVTTSNRSLVLDTFVTNKIEYLDAYDEEVNKIISNNGTEAAIEKPADTIGTTGAITTTEPTVETVTVAETGATTVTKTDTVSTDEQSGTGDSITEDSATGVSTEETTGTITDQNTRTKTGTTVPEETSENGGIYTISRQIADQKNKEQESGLSTSDVISNVTGDGVSAKTSEVTSGGISESGLVSEGISREDTKYVYPGEISKENISITAIQDIYGIKEKISITETQEIEKQNEKEKYNWQDYFLETKYYKKYILKSESKRSVYVAEIISDRMLTYIPDSENPFKINDENLEIIPGDSMVADGESIMMINVTVFDSLGKIDKSSKNVIRFSATDTDIQDIVTFENGNLISPVNGVATAYIKAGRKIGRFVLKAELIGDLSPVAEKEIFLVSGAPENIDIQTDSKYLVSNGVSETKIKVTLKDKYNNTANNSFEKILVTVDSEYAELSGYDEKDENGYIFNTLEGFKEFSVKSKNKTGQTNLSVYLVSPLEPNAELNTLINSGINLIFLNKIDLKIETNKKINGNINYLIDVINQDTKLDYNGEIKLKTLNPKIGMFVDQAGISRETITLKMKNGSLNPDDALMVLTNLSGELSVLAEIPGYASEKNSVYIPAGAAYKIVLESESDSILSNVDEPFILKAKLYDKYDNPVINENSKTVVFEASKSSAEYISFVGTNSQKVKNGEALVSILPASKSGYINIIAKSNGLIEGKLSLKIKKRLDQNTFQDMSVGSLIVTVLGGNFGEVNKTEMLDKFIYHGKSQSVISNTFNINSSKRLLSIDQFGKIDALSDDIEYKFEKITGSDFTPEYSISENSNKKIFSVILKIPANLKKYIGTGNNQGIYLEKIIDDENYKLNFNEGGVEIKNNDELLFRLDEENKITLKNGVEFAISDDISDGPLFLIKENGRDFANLKIVYNFGKIIVSESGTEKNSLENGLYIIQDQSFDLGKYQFINSFSRDSGNIGTGLTLVDTENEIESKHLPSPDINSLEDIKLANGLGFTGQNKFMLLLSAGNSVGESFIPYASESGIVFGDPMIKVKTPNTPGITNFAKDIGKNIFFGKDEINSLISLDFNGDNREDLLIIFKNGLIRLFENSISNKRFIDRGNIIKVFGEVYSGTKIDVNNDNFDDLLIGTKDSCRQGEECLSLYLNVGGSFLRKYQDLKVGGKVLEMKSKDLNLDGCEDLVLSDSSQNVRIFYNRFEDGQCVGLEENYSNSFNVGYAIDSNKNIIESAYINYASQNINDNKVDLSVNGTTTTYYSIQKDSAFLTSNKFAKDDNGESIALDDTVTYTVTLKNNSSSDIKDLSYSDIFNPSVSVQEDSIKCLDLNCKDDLEWINTGMILRTGVISGISIPANSERKIQYSVKINGISKVNFDIGSGFSDYPNSNDKYPDIFVRPEYNPENKQIFIYSTGVLDENEHVVYLKNVSNLKQEPVDSEVSATTLDPNSADFADQVSNLQNSEELQSQISDILAAQSEDANYDGLPDSFGNSGNAVEDFISDAGALAKDVEKGIKDATKLLRCSGGGCLPSPYNYALFAPYYDPTDPTALVMPGIPAVSITSVFPFVLPFVPSAPDSYVRFYVSPTLTMGIGFAVCLGPGGQGASAISPCYAYAVPMKELGLCPDIVGSLNDVVSSIKNAVADPDVGMTTVVSTGEENVSEDLLTMSGESAWSDPDAGLAANAKFNIRIPGFPSVVTDWLDAQTEEIFNKLLDLPDFYFIYPDIGSFLSNNVQAMANFGKINSFNDFLRAVNSIPLIQIESKEIIIRLPAISADEIEKWKRQAELWIKYEEAQLEMIEQYWMCDSSSKRRTICDILTTNINGIIGSLRDIMSKLDLIANLPRDILNLRTIEAKYATQIICYLDAIMTFTGGYMKKQQKIIESWMKTIEDAIKIFRDWKIILDLSIDYQASCDKCKAEQFTKMGMLLSFLAVLPTEIPVIQFPKLPDIVFDMSQVKAGTRIIWPDFVFVPEKITLPDLPLIKFPQFLPDDVEIDLSGLTAALDAIKMPDWMDKFPNLKLDLALEDLPPLPLPKLPDLPRPPKIPSLPDFVKDIVTSIKPIFTILCLLKEGILPVQEMALGKEIEELTAPSVRAILPFIKNLAVQMPAIEYEYASEIKVTAKINFGISTDFIYVGAKFYADKFNDKVKQMVKFVNAYTDIPLQGIVDYYINDPLKKYTKKLEQYTNEQLNKAESGVNTFIEDTSTQINEAVTNTAEDVGDKILYIDDLKKNTQNLYDTVEEYNQIIGSENYAYSEEYELKAETIYLDKDNPLLNRKLSELKNNYDYPFEDENMSRLANIKDSMISYVEGIESSNKILAETDDYNEYVNYIAGEQSKSRQLASLFEELNDSYNTDTSKFVTPSNTAKDPEIENKKNESKKLIADLATDILGDSTSGTSSSTDSVPKGFFISNGTQSENVLNYKDELNSIKFIYLDVDNDEDLDMIYSMSGDIYIKENLKNTPQYDNGSFTLELSKNTISEYVDNNYLVENLSTDFENVNKTELKFEPADDAKGYEIYVFNSIYRDQDSLLKKYFAGADASFSSENYGNNEFEKIILSDNENPNIELPLKNGAYYISVYAVFEDNNKSFASTITLSSPDICYDREAPLPAMEKTEYEVNIFETLILDARNSFDSDGEIQKYYLEVLPYISPQKTTNIGNEIWSDSNVNQDQDGDGIRDNDRNNPVFRLGPFENSGDLGTHEFILHVVDQSNNSSSQKITVDVKIPVIKLDKTVSDSGIISGSISEQISEYPFSVYRKRYSYTSSDEKLQLISGTQKIVTNSADARSKYRTDENGLYTISDLNREDIIEIKDSNGNIVGEINPQTGNIGNLENGYTVEIINAVPPLRTTEIVIKNNNDEIVGSIFFSIDSNNDIKIYVEKSFEGMDFMNMSGVFVNDLISSDDFEFIKIKSDNGEYTGGVALYYSKENKNVLLVDTGGNILVLDDRIKLKQKENNHIADPFVISVEYLNTAVSEIFIAAGKNDSYAKFTSRDQLPISLPEAPPANMFYGRSEDKKILDVDENLNAFLEILKEKGIISFREDKNGYIYNPQELISRAEFVKTFLTMLCIVPGEAAYRPYTSGEAKGGYADVQISQNGIPWYYPYVKQADLFGLVEGYKGNIDQESGLVMFLPDRTIALAEGVAIIVRALDYKKILEIGTINEGTPWYLNYLIIARNLTPFLKTGLALPNNYILTETESDHPDLEMTRGDLIKLASRVLQTYNCFSDDLDNDGMSDYCEAKYQIDDPNDDPDKDGVKNADECYNNMNPLNSDSDEGGINDGQELSLGSNPLNGEDDGKDSDNDMLSDVSEILVYKTDPFDADTDNGGVKDGEEVKNQTDPLNKNDDLSNQTVTETFSGIYIVPGECISCPCEYSFSHSADILPGDVFFTVISTYDESSIFTKSNEVTINKL